MAHFRPSLPPRRALTAGDHAELVVLRLLEDGLSDAYTLFHSVDWTDALGADARHGEVDIVIVNQAGDVMQLEVKAGVVDFTSNGIFKTYAGTRKDVAGQLNAQYGAMRSRLDAAGLSVKLLQRLVLTDARAAGQPVNYTAEGAFATLAGQAQDLLADKPANLDLLLEDPEQQLYADREPFAVEGEAVITSNENFRSPRALVRLCNLLRLTDEPVEALGPHEGTVPDPVTYADPRGLSNATRQAVQRCLDLGFALEDVAVITLRGRGSSALLQLDQLGPWALRRFTGAYDEQANPMWTPGPLLADTVYRFKGQSAPAVVLTECDFEQWDDKARRLLFVGLTRARLHLEWVVSERAGEVLAGGALAEVV